MPKFLGVIRYIREEKKVLKWCRRVTVGSRILLDDSKSFLNEKTTYRKEDRD